MTAAGDTALITKDTLIGAAEGQVKVTPAGAGKDDLKFTLRDGSTFRVSLNGATKVQDILDKINNATGNGGKLVASFDEAKQQISVYGQDDADGGDERFHLGDADREPCVLPQGRGDCGSGPRPHGVVTETLNFALRVGTLRERVFVTVEGDTYTGTDG